METLKNTLVPTIVDFTREYGHKAEQNGTEIFANACLTSKANLMEHLRKSAYWDEEQMAIILKSEYSRDFDSNLIDGFQGWLLMLTNQRAEKCPTNVIYKKLSEKRWYWKHQYNIYYYEGNDYDALLKQGEAFTEWLECCEEIRKIPGKNWCGSVVDYDLYEELDKIDTLKEIIGTLKERQSQFITEETEAIVHKRFPEAKCVVGQKCSKVINAIGKMLGLHAEPDWNREFAKVADGFNPLRYETYTIVSVNPLDFLTMSFGHSWASCQTIDIDNIRPDNGENHYHGMYCSGTTSLAEDEYTVVLYTVSSDYDNPTEMWKADKLRRCLFYISDNGEILGQSRVYPDGRDGGDAGIASQFRTIMQDIVAQCWNIPNMWTIRKSGSVNPFLKKDCEATYYADFQKYTDVNVSLNKEFSEFTPIYIGKAPICLCCGKKHSVTDRLTCKECAGIKQCAECGCDFDLDEDNYVYDEYTGNYYCSESCARDRDVHYIENADHWTSDPNTFCDWCNGLYYYDSECEVCANDGHKFYTEYNARCAGYIEVENQNGELVWMKKSHTFLHTDGNYYTYPENIDINALADDKGKEVHVGDFVMTIKEFDYNNHQLFPLYTIGKVEAIYEGDKLPYRVWAYGDYWYYSRDMFIVCEKREENNT